MSEVMPVLLHGPWGQIESWLLDGPPAVAALLEQVAWSPVLSESSFVPGEEELRELWRTGGWVSWLGGPGVAPLRPWPARSHGPALAHVLSLDLGDLDGVLDAQGKIVWPGLREGLPATGVLEVFHDLQTAGLDAADRESGTWLVRWVPEPDRTALVDPPETTPAPGPVCQVALPMPGFTLPPAADAAGGPTEEFEVAEQLQERWPASWLVQRTGSSAGQPIPVSHFYGHSQARDVDAAWCLLRLG